MHHISAYMQRLKIVLLSIHMLLWSIIESYLCNNNMAAWPRSVDRRPAFAAISIG